MPVAGGVAPVLLVLVLGLLSSTSIETAGGSVLKASMADVIPLLPMSADAAATDQFEDSPSVYNSKKNKQILHEIKYISKKNFIVFNTYIYS